MIEFRNNFVCLSCPYNLCTTLFLFPCLHYDSWVVGAGFIFLKYSFYPSLNLSSHTNFLPLICVNLLSECNQNVCRKVLQLLVAANFFIHWNSCLELWFSTLVRCHVAVQVLILNGVYYHSFSQYLSCGNFSRTWKRYLNCCIDTIVLLRLLGEW